VAAGARAVAHTLNQPEPDLDLDPETSFREAWLPTLLDSLSEDASLVLLFDVLADPQKEQAAAAFFPYLRGLLAGDPERLPRDFGLELRSLTKQGFVKGDAAIPGGWRVRPVAFLWWLADELLRATRSDRAFEEWLRTEGLEGSLTREEKQQWHAAIKGTMGVLERGVTTLIEAMVNGVGDTAEKAAR
jgi:hypothetical protein